MMKVIDIELKNVTTVRGFHRVVKKALQAPDYYGYNLDALNDVLTSINEETQIIFHHFGAIKKALPEYADTIDELLTDVTEDNDNLEIITIDGE